MLASELRKHGFPTRPKPTYWLIIPDAGGDPERWLRREPLSASEPVLILAASVSLAGYTLCLSFLVSERVTAIMVPSS